MLNPRLKIALELERLKRHNEIVLHPLKQLFWECTLRCNLHCQHCGSDCKMNASVADMPKEDFLKVLDEEIIPNIQNANEIMIILSGGEPTMRNDLPQIGQALLHRGFPWGMVSNGMTLTDQKLHTLMEAGMHALSISLDGLKDLHNQMRGSQVAFDGALRAIQAAAQQKQLIWDVVTCVNTHTLSQLDALRDMLYSLGCRQWRLFGIDPMGRAQNRTDLLLSGKERKILLDFIVKERQKGDMDISYACEGFFGSYEGRIRDHMFHCAAGISVASILADGSISGCTSIRGKYYQGNIYQDHFWQVWEKGFQSYRDRNWMRAESPCRTCQMWRYCEGGGMHLRREDGSLMLCHLHDLCD